MTRKQIIMSTVAVAIVLTAGGFAVKNGMEAKAAQQNLNYSYTRAMEDLRDSIKNVQTTLEKGAYANTTTQQNGLAARLMRQTSLAKGALSALPVDDDSLNTVSKFITQVGDLSMTLSEEVSAGKQVTDEQYDTMKQLSKYAQTLNQDLTDVKPDFNGQFSEQLKETAEDFTDFPSLIYDGPFSDEVIQKKPQFLEGKEEISQGNAALNAEKFLGIDVNSLNHTQDTEGNLPTYNFTLESAKVSVSKQGGEVVTYQNTREISEENIGIEEAKTSAQNFLSSRGLSNMTERYYVKHDGRVTFNFAFEQGDACCYPDLIKVSVALDNGEITEYNATGYIMNHKERELPSPELSVEQAQEKVSPHLTVKSHRLSLIPTKGSSETLCWEFLCDGDNGDQVLVYINTQTGFEEQILILETGDLGTLVF